MNTHHIKYFVDACENKSLTASAKINYVSQAAITLAIRSIENELDVKIISHKKREFSLTQEGKLFYEYGKDYLNRYRLFKNDLKSKQDDITLKIGCTNSMFVRFVSKSIVKLKKKYKKLSIDIKLTSTDLIERGIENNSFDIGITIDLKNQPKAKTIYNGNFIASVNKETKEFNKDTILVTRKHKPEVLKFQKLFEKKFKRKLIIKDTILSWEGIKNLLSLEECMGLIPDYLLDSKLKKIHHSPEIPYKLLYLANGQYHNHEIYEVFYDLLKEELSRTHDR
jgi:hypothetical protein